MIPEIKPYLHFTEFLSQFRAVANPVQKFEVEFGKFTGFKYALYFPMARSALFALLKTLGIENKRIILPAYTCLVVPQAVVWSKNVPLFIDNSENDINMDNDLIRKNLGEDTPVVLFTSLFGRKHNPNGIVEEIRNRGKLVVQDSSLAFGVTHNGRSVSHFSDVAMFSTNAGKPLSSYGGGFLTFHDQNLYKDVKEFRNRYFRKPRFRDKWILQLSFNLQYLAFNNLVYGLVTYLKDNTNIIDVFVKQNEEDFTIPQNHYFIPASFQAKIGLIQIKKFEEMERKRKELALLYTDNINETEIIRQVPFLNCDSLSHYHLKIKVNRDKFGKYLLQNGIFYGKHFDYSNPYLPIFEEFRTEECPHSLIWAKEMIGIPFYPGMKLKTARRIIDVINNYTG